METKIGKPSAAPDPVSGDRVDDQTDQCTVSQIGRKLCTLCHGPGNDGCGCGTKYSLKDHEDTRSEIFKLLQVNGCWIEKACGADDRIVASEHQGKSNDKETKGAEDKVHQVFHDDVARIFCSCKTCLNHCEACLHEEDKES